MRCGFSPTVFESSQKLVHGGPGVHTGQLVQQVRRIAHASAASPSQVNGGDLRALVAECVADGLASDEILNALLECEHPRNRAARGRSLPPGQGLVAALRIVMPE